MMVIDWKVLFSKAPRKLTEAFFVQSTHPLITGYDNCLVIGSFLGFLLTNEIVDDTIVTIG